MKIRNRALLLVTVALAIPPCALHGEALPSDEFFNPEIVHGIRLRINPADWQRLKQNYKDNTYYPCVFQWRGTSMQVGIRSAGLSTRNDVKPALRVDFNRYEEGQEFLALKSIRLKNLTYDASMVRERIVMSFYRRMGIPAPRTAHARLFVNDEYAGLYLVVDSIDKPFLKRNVGEDGGYLYKYEYAGPYRFEYLGSDPSRYSPLPFEPHTHEDAPNVAAIIAMIRTANQSSDADFARAMSGYVDLKLFLAQLAIEMYFAESDGLVAHHGMANFYLYQFTGKSAFQFIPWDKDRTFFDTGDSIWRGTKDNVLTRRALEVPELRQAYMETLWKSTALAGGAGGWLEREIASASSLVRTAAAEDPLKLCPNPYWGETRPCSIQDFDEEVARIIQFARERCHVVKQQLTEASFEPPAEAPRLLEMGPVSEEGPAVLVPGSLASAFGQAFAGTETAAEPGAPLPTSLGGVSVVINGISAPVLFVSPSLVHLQVPWEIAPGEVLITVVRNGLFSGTITAAVGTAAPAALAVAHLDGVRVSLDRPVAPGDPLLVFATGLGAVAGGTLTGQPAPASPLLHTTESLSVTIGDLPAEVSFSGLAPGLVGVYQINVRVPEAMSAGPDTLLTISMAGQTSTAVALPTRERQ